MPCVMRLWVWFAVGVWAVAAAHGQAPDPPATTTFYVATNGNDEWSGSLAEPNAEGTDGPLATLVGARDAVRQLREQKREADEPLEGAVHVLIRGGTYTLSEPFVLEPQDSGLLGAPVRYAAYADEMPIISGGRRIADWKQEGELWTTEVADVVTSDWRFATLWVNGARRSRARTPNEGYFRTAGKAPPTENPTTGEIMVRSTTGFLYEEGDVQRWHNLEDALVVVLHAWETSMHHIASIDEEQRLVIFRNAAPWAFENRGPRQRYYVENTIEGLDQPGEWYLDRETGKLSYYPMPGEDLATVEVIAPTLRWLVQLDGSSSTGQFVQYVHFDGLGFHHTNYPVGAEGYAETGFAVGVPAAFQARGARFCAIEDCEIAHVDTYAIWLRVGSYGNRLVGNHLHDLGAGGVRIGERQRSNPNLDVTHNLVDNNLIHDVGHVYSSGVGVWIGQSYLNTVSHNEICDLSNSAVSVGWAWGVDLGFSYDNLVEYNYIHHIGRGEFSNMAGIYVLGGSTRTALRNNVIHDVNAYQYGGWGIHADEGSANLRVENNVVYNTTSGGLDQYYGNLNCVRNNIFAFSRESQLSLSNTNNPVPVLFERNIVVTDNALPFGMNWDVANNWMDYNCYYDATGAEMDFGGLEFGQWQAQGKDAHSILADPLFEDLEGRDFALRPESPALALGFRPIDTSLAGLYGDPEWVGLPKTFTRISIMLADTFGTEPVAEDFESVAAKSTPPGASLYGVDGRAGVEVTEETAAAGDKSLKFIDTDGPQEVWQPEMGYTPRFREGTAVVSFDVRLEPGAVFQHDWRSDWTGRRVGPRITFEPGKLSVGDDTETALMELPESEWFHVEVECPLGASAPVPATYDLAVTLPGEEPQRFEDLPCMYRRFRVIERAWFLANAAQETAFYLDNVRIELR